MTAGDFAICRIAGGHRPPLQKCRFGTCLQKTPGSEGVNELQERMFPSSERRGGCAINKDAAKPPYEGADGVVSPG